jgi:hypothetical protein
MQWDLWLEGWPNTAARLAGRRRVTQQGVILYVMDGPCRLPLRTTPLAPVCCWSVTKCTQNTAMSYVSYGWKIYSFSLITHAHVTCARIHMKPGWRMSCVYQWRTAGGGGEGWHFLPSWQLTEDFTAITTWLYLFDNVTQHTLRRYVHGNSTYGTIKTTRRAFVPLVILSTFIGCLKSNDTLTIYLAEAISFF